MFSACWPWLISGNSSVRSLLWISEFVLPVFIIDVLDLISFNKHLSFALLFVSEIWGSPLPHILEQDETTAMIQADNENFKWCQLVVSFLKRTAKLKPWLTPEYEPLSIQTCLVMRTRRESVVLGDAVPPGCQVLRSLLHLWPVWAGWACNQLEADLLLRLSPACQSSLPPVLQRRSAVLNNTSFAFSGPSLAAEARLIFTAAGAPLLTCHQSLSRSPPSTIPPSHQSGPIFVTILPCGSTSSVGHLCDHQRGPPYVAPSSDWHLKRFVHLALLLVGF